jgi:hypothetical protein
MTRVSGSRITVELPVGWEGDIGPRQHLTDGAERLPVAHFANLPLRGRRGDFGAGVVEQMTAGDALVVLFEYEPEAAQTELFKAAGLPGPLTPADFDRDNMQRPLPGQSGVQRFFHVGNRAFCLYVAVGSHLDRADVLPQINEVIASLELG